MLFSFLCCHGTGSVCYRMNSVYDGIRIPLSWNEFHGYNIGRADGTRAFDGYGVFLIA